MTAPTNLQLQAQIKEIDKKGERRHRSMLATISKFRTDIHNQLQPFHDYLVGQTAINENQSNINKRNAINVDPKVYDLIKWLILIIGTIVGVRLV